MPIQLSIERALEITAVSQRLIPLGDAPGPGQSSLSAGTDALASISSNPAPGSDDSPDGPLRDTVAAAGGIPATLNHVPHLCLFARRATYRPEDLIADQEGLRPTLARTAGPQTGITLAPLDTAPAFCRLAATTGKLQSEHLVQSLLAPPAVELVEGVIKPQLDRTPQVWTAEEIRTLVRWIHEDLRSGASTYLELRERAPEIAFRPVEKGSERAFYRETALQQVLDALTQKGDVLSTLVGGLNTSEGPFRYYLRTQLVPGPLPSAEEAYRQIAGLYTGAFAPVGAKDLSSWSGLPETNCRRAIGGLPATLRTVEIPGLGDDYLVPETYLDRAALASPVCFALPWLDPWLSAYRDMVRFLPDGPLGPLTSRDMVLVSIGPGIPARHSLAARVRVVGSAREPRFVPEPWRTLAQHESKALEVALERVTSLFRGDGT
jgi:hypothetical protein